MIAGPKVWNSLPSNIRTITNLVDFKKKLKNFFYRKVLCKAPMNQLETERYINFNIIIIIIIIRRPHSSYAKIWVQGKNIPVLENKSVLDSILLYISCT